MNLKRRLKDFASRTTPGLLKRLSVYKNRTYIQTLKELDYTPLPDEGKTYSSQVDVVSDFLVRGWKLIVEGNHMNLRFTYQGKQYDYVEPLYLKANPDVAQSVRQGHFKHGLDHFLRLGYREIKEGKRKPYDESAAARILRKVKGSAAQEGGYLCLFAHYDPDGIVDPYVMRYLEALREMGCDLVLISGSINDENIEKIKPLCLEIIVRNETGRDFGSWYLALKDGWNVPDKYEFILWANDSVYFPVRPVDQLMDWVKERQFEYWGITDSRQAAKVNYHIQSYFLGFSSSAIKAGIFDEFFELYESHPVLSKHGQIATFEVGLSDVAIEKCLRVGAYCNIEDAYQAAICAGTDQSSISLLNPSIQIWDVLLAKFDCPALKVDLVRNNPGKLFSWDLAETLIDQDFYDLKLLKGHARRLNVGGWSKKPEAKLEVVRRFERGAFTGSDKLSFFAHYDPVGRIAPYVIRYLDALAELGSETIFITTINDDGELSKLPESCKRVIVKNDAGRDFGSWWLAMKDLEPELLRYKTYIIANDSVYYPVADDKRMFREMEAEGYDFWGVVESDQLAWHFMSYLWVLGSEPFLKELMPRFLKEYVPSYTKWDQIRNYELRYPKLLRQAGYKVGAYVKVADVEQLVLARHPGHANKSLFGQTPFNSHVDFWEVIASELNCPCMKVELVRDNPTGAKNLNLLPEVLQQAGTYPYALIEEHMKSLGKG